MRQLVEKLGEVEEVTEKDSKGRSVKKYALVKEREEKPSDKVLWGYGPSGLRSITVGDLEIEYPPNKMLLELAAWIKSKPMDWTADDDDNIKRAKLCLEHCPYIVPDVGRPLEDPDSYVFVWSEEARETLNLGEPLSSRFFDLKLIYDAMRADSSKEISSVGPVFVGVYCSPVVVGYVGYHTHMQPLRWVGRPNVYRVIEEPQSVCVAVRKEAGTSISVVHVETREGKLDKAWVSGVAEQLNAKKWRMIGYDSLKEDVRRKLLLNLRRVLEQHRLQISGRYPSLIEDLWNYSYRKPSSGYVLALAIAIDLAEPAESYEGI